MPKDQRVSAPVGSQSSKGSHGGNRAGTQGEGKPRGRSDPHAGKDPHRGNRKPASQGG